MYNTKSFCGQLQIKLVFKGPATHPV